MVSTDPISDMFSRIRNAILVNKTDVNLPHSNLKEDVAKTLVKSGFIKGVDVSDEPGRKQLKIYITAEDQPALISHIKRLSKPGRRVYVQSKEIPTIKRGRGIIIISTPQGVMTGSEAKTKKLGGELIGEVY